MRRQWMLTALFSAVVVSVGYATQADDAWLAWVGCWRPEGEVSERSLCIVPDGEGVRMVTLNGMVVETESRVVANAQPRSITQEGCSGNETSFWSADRHRVFLNAELNCGNNATRKVSGVFAMLSTSRWASVQTITTAGNTATHIVRYSEVQPDNLPADIAQAFRDNRLARETHRLSASGRIELDDVREAVTRVETPVVEGWLTTVGQEFRLDAADLIALADAGVPASVIDVLVALSHPRHFAVREERASERETRGRRPVGCMDSYWGNPYDPFGYRSGYGYGYGCGGSRLYPVWGGGYWGGGSVIVIDRPSIRSRGKVTKAGYQGPRDGTATVPSTSSSTSRASTPAKSSGDSDSGSSGSSGGRKAKPRDN